MQSCEFFKSQPLISRKKSTSILEIQLLCLLLRFGSFKESAISTLVLTEMGCEIKVPINSLKLVMLHTKKGFYKSTV